MEASCLNKRGDRSIQVASTAKPLPYRIQAILPTANTRIWGRAMLTENQFTARPEHAAHLSQCGGRIRNSAERVRHDHGVDTVVL
jgi:hypothetical protein